MKQMTNNSSQLPDFHAVEFMRQIRAKHAEQYQNDRQRYVDNARKAMEKFKELLKMPAANRDLEQAGQTE